MPEQMLPCPFCGQPNPSVYQSGGYWKVKCVDGCSIAISGYIKKESAIGAWNRRPDGAGEPDPGALCTDAQHLGPVQLLPDGNVRCGACGEEWGRMPKNRFRSSAVTE